MAERPWVSGPKEMLLHALEHSRLGKPFDQRVALVSVDNAVELAIQTYLGLPDRTRGRPGPPRRELDDARGKLPALIELLEKYAANQLSAENIDDILYYHRLRNTLYHEGNGIAVESDKVEAYLEIARILFQSLFDVDVRGEVLPVPHSDRAQFLSKWGEFESLLKALASDEVGWASGTTSDDPAGSLSATELSKLRALRNSIVHGNPEPQLVRQALRQVERAEEEVSARAGVDAGMHGLCPARQKLPKDCFPYLANRESGSQKHAQPRLVTNVGVQVAPGVAWNPIEYSELERRFAGSGYRRGYVLAFVPGGTESEIRDRGVRLNEGRGTQVWGVRYMYNALGCWGYPITLIGGVYRLWTVDESGDLVSNGAQKKI